jgi:hypothetical protein
MKLIASLVIFLSFAQTCFSQSDSTVVYMNGAGQETTKDSAYNYVVFIPNGGIWSGKTYDIKSKFLTSEGNYAEKKLNSKVGSFKYYSEDGTLYCVTMYEKGREKEITYYYKSGARKSYIAYGGKGVEKEVGWDEKGNEVSGYIVRREARFKGGMQAWIAYLQQNLKAEVAVESGAPAGRYTTIVTFLVAQDGTISEVVAADIPARCKACAEEAVRVIKTGPNWEPALINNSPVTYRQKQSITFEVTEEKKRRLW